MLDLLRLTFVACFSPIVTTRSTTSTMCVATALLISIFFQLLHSCYYPYNRDGLNRLQQLALTVSRL